MEEIWDKIQKKHIEMPKEMVEFLHDIKKVCEEHGLSVSHQDGHGSFMIEKYDDFNLERLYRANKNY